jgi:hypothetical protein
MHFKEFTTEWVKHLLKSQVRIWADTSLSLYISEQEALYKNINKELIFALEPNLQKISC